MRQSILGCGQEGPQRKTMLVLQQVIMMGELAVNRVRNNHNPG